MVPNGAVTPGLPLWGDKAPRAGGRLLLLHPLEKRNSLMSWGTALAGGGWRGAWEEMKAAESVCPGSVSINTDGLIHMWCLYRHRDTQTFVVIPTSTTY